MKIYTENFWRPVSVLVLMAAMLLLTSGSQADSRIAYVSDGTNRWVNWDIYLLDLATGVSTQLTTHAAIDNHPDLSPDGQWVVFSSTRGASAEFDLYLGDATNVEDTLRQLTFDAYTNGPQTSYPDRHPHFHPNGRIIVFSSKNRPLEGPVELISECSVPKIIVPPRFYEGMNVIQLDAAGNTMNYVELDIRAAWDQSGFSNIWVTNSSTYIGHPSFNHAGNKIVFSGSIDGEGKNWEVYTVGFDTNTLALVTNSLRRVTLGPDIGPNPIKMTAGAHFSEDDSYLLFSSTRTALGNSQIFRLPVPASVIDTPLTLDTPVTNAVQLTDHPGNDYVPEPLTNGSFLVASDLGTNTLSGQDWGPTYDLDIVLIDTTGERTVLGNEGANEMPLLGDEVSWFCGLKPNLSDNIFLPRVMNVEALWLEQNASTYIPTNLLSGYGYPNQAQQIYALGWENMNAYMSANSPEWPTILNCLQQLNAHASHFPGLADEAALRDWLAMTEALRAPKHVVASIMYKLGIGAPYGIQSIANSDFDGDHKADPALYDNRTGTWRVKLSAGGYSELNLTGLLGGPGWMPASADYDGDRKADPAVYEETTGNLDVKFSESDYSQLNLTGFLGGPGWTPASADYDGDGLADPAVYEERAGNWKMKPSLANYSELELSGLLGGPDYSAVPADYDGDGLADPAVYNRTDGTWLIRISGNNYELLPTPLGFLGGTGWMPAPGDFDGDGLADPAVIETSTGNIAARLSGGNYVRLDLPGFFDVFIF